MTAAETKNGALVSGAATVVFAARYESVEITNEDAVKVLYARTDGVTPASPWDDSIYIGPGETVALTNEAAAWWPPDGGTNPGTTVILVGPGGADTTKFSVSGY
jgi:hypothetical protein